jgi:hypothetical protein
MAEDTETSAAVALESDHLQNLAEARLVSRLGIPDRTTSYTVVEVWHELTHAGAFRFCAEQPCHALNYRRWAR